MKEYGSNLYLTTTIALNKIRKKRTTKNEVINAQLLPKRATHSEIF